MVRVCPIELVPPHENDRVGDIRLGPENGGESLLDSNPIRGRAIALRFVVESNPHGAIQSPQLVRQILRPRVTRAILHLRPRVRELERQPRHTTRGMIRHSGIHRARNPRRLIVRAMHTRRPTHLILESRIGSCGGRSHIHFPIRGNTILGETRSAGNVYWRSSVTSGTAKNE